MKKAFYDTTVATSKSQQQIDALLNKHGVEAIRWTQLSDRAVLEFKSAEGSFAITARYELGDVPNGERRKRQVMRALHWYVKAKLDAVDFGLEDMVKAFMPYLITAPNRTLIDDVSDAMAERRLGAEIPLLPSG